MKPSNNAFPVDDLIIVIHKYFSNEINNLNWSNSKPTYTEFRKVSIIRLIETLEKEPSIISKKI